VKPRNKNIRAESLWMLVFTRFGEIGTDNFYGNMKYFGNYLKRA
jgi:hypothetical protein